MISLNSRKSTTKIPVYLDGYAQVYRINQTDDTYPVPFLVSEDKAIPFRMMSITDRTRIEFEQRNINLTMKLRVPKTLEIDSNNVLRIGSTFHKVFNAYHFTNADGFEETDLTLKDYPNAKVGDPNDNQG